MNVIKLVKSKSFKEKDQFQKRDLVKNYMLQEESCHIGSRVMCFEIEPIVKDRDRFFYSRYGIKKVKNMTIGKFYTILEYKNKKIKLLNDIDKPHWFTINRFLYTLKLERKDKLKIINKHG